MRDQKRGTASDTENGNDVIRIIPPAALSNTLRELRESVEALLDLPATERSNGTHSAPDAAQLAGLRIVIRRLCEGAHEQDVRAEHLIIFVKSAWSGLPHGESVTGKPSQLLTLSELVTACIDEFYQDAPATRNGKFLNGDARSSSQAMHDGDHP